MEDEKIIDSAEDRPLPPRLTEDELRERATRLDLPYVRPDTATVDQIVIEQVPESTARRLRALPLFLVEASLSVAMTDPTDVLALDELRRITGYAILPALCGEEFLQDAFDRYYRVDSTIRVVLERMKDTKKEIEEDESVRHRIDDVESGHDIVDLVNMILLQAVRDGASDIHVEPDDHLFRIRYRVDGVLREAHSAAMGIHPAFTSRLKTMSNMDITEKRLPQDGRMLVRTGGKEIDFRVSSLPTVQGEKVVLRILDQEALRLDLDHLGFPDGVKQAWLKLINHPDGMILVTGPTGSGKTSTLYSTLQKLNSIDRNIITVEDPVEYNFPVINQVQVNDKAGLVFSSVLRSILRQDPDIVMVGEIRDRTTAEIGIRAALTGHLVLSTLHTNDSVSAVTRLVDMGIPPFLVATTIRGILAQRLIRMICSKCRARTEPEGELLHLAGLSPSDARSMEFYKGNGCRACSNTGYRGRTGVYEVLVFSHAVNRAIVAEKSESEIVSAARKEGAFCRLWDDGMDKARQGITTLEEVIRVTRVAEEAEEARSEAGEPLPAAPEGGAA